MGCFRIYVGNLPPSVTAEELKSKFQTFCSRVGDELEIKNKNESTFAYLNLYVDEAEGHKRGEAPLKYEQLPNNIQKCIAVMNNTKWKGNLIKVQLAKESFLSKLKKEQEGYKAEPHKRNNQSDGRNEEQSKNNLVRPAFHHDEKSTKLLALAGMGPIAPPKKDTDYNNHEHKKPPRNHDANPVDSSSSSAKLLALAGMAPLSPPKKDRNFKRDEVAKPDYDFEIVSSSTPAVGKSFENKRKIAAQYSSDSSDSEPEVKEGFIPKFRGLLQSFPESIQKNSVPEESSAIKIHAVATKDNDSPKAAGIKFNQSKRQKSNDLRLKSMENRFMHEKKKTDVIKHSLKNFNAPPHPENLQSSNSKEMSSKKVKAMELFNEEDDDDNYTPNFELKKQFEGESGQRLLELKSKWNFDERFNIDERFKEPEENHDHATEEDGTNIEKEKAGEMDILNQMFGHEAKPTSGKNKKANSDFVIVPRFDPTLDDHKEKYEQRGSESNFKPNEGKVKKKASEKFPKELPISKESEQITGVSEAPPKKVEYTVAPNLKSLFSADSSSQNNESNKFSLLSAFGSKENDGQQQHRFLENGDSKQEEPRKFWQSNPFKYDSSDEDEDDTKKVSKTPAAKYVPFIKKDSFFFKSKDPRFECIEKFFLVADEDFATINKNFNDVDRAELKSLVKAKIKNTKRKSDKRDEALKRLRRKLKLKKKQVTKSNKKKFAVKV